MSSNKAVNVWRKCCNPSSSLFCDNNTWQKIPSLSCGCFYQRLEKNCVRPIYHGLSAFWSMRGQYCRTHPIRGQCSLALVSSEAQSNICRGCIDQTESTERRGWGPGELRPGQDITRSWYPRFFLDYNTDKDENSSTALIKLRLCSWVLSSSGSSLTSWLTPRQVYEKSREDPEIGSVMGWSTTNTTHPPTTQLFLAVNC